MYTLQREGAAAVEHIKIEDLQSFCLEKVQVAILDQDGEDQAPFVSKTIQKLELCPDNTHLRIYFDRQYLFCYSIDHQRFLEMKMSGRLMTGSQDYNM